MTSTSGNSANNFARQPQRRQEWVGAGEQPLRDIQAWRLGRKRQEKRSHSILVAIRTAT
jgi:hypothetical protein